MTPLRRRTALTTISTATAAALAGCTDLLASDTDEDGEDIDTDKFEDAAATFVDDLANGRLEDIREQFVPEMRSQYASLAQLEQTWLGYTAIGGEFEEIVDTSVTEQEETYTARVSMAFERGDHVLLLAMNEEYQYGEYIPGDEYEQPAYVDPDAVSETEVTLETEIDGCSLSGLVTTPADTEGEVPGVVLVHDAGRVTMDSETRATRLFRDLAEGLATQDIATVRYNKRTTECDLADDEYGIDSVAVDDALAAADELRDFDGVDADRLVVVGHGLGGLAAPRIADRDGDLAGVIGLAAPARSFAEVVLEQAEHQATVGDYEWETRAERVDEWSDQIDQMSEGEYDADDLLVGYYGSLWNSLAEYDQVAVASDLEVPTYFLQGDRDTRATVEDDLERWESELEGDSSVEVYDGLNHAFMPGEGPVVPFEYDLQNNADERVVDDIAAWIDEL